MIKRGCGCTVLLLMAAPWALSQTALTLADSGASPGATITLPLSVAVRSGTPVAGLQWTLTYPASVAAVQVNAGPETTRAAKQLSCHSPATGRQTCIIVGLNTTTLSNGVVANVVVTIAGSATAGTFQVHLEDGVAATPAGNMTGLATTPAVINITPPAVSISALSCSPSLLTAGQTAQCTVTLTRPGPAVVSLGRAAAQATDIVMPASLTIPAGITSGTFAVQARSVLASSTLEIVATINQRSRTVTLSLAPGASPVSVSLEPRLVYLGASATQQFRASVTGTPNQRVTWSIMPAGAGTISSSGLYTAPSRIAGSTIVIVLATSVINAARVATGYIVLDSAADRVPPVISSVAFVPAVTSAMFSWNNSEPATSRVVFGSSPGNLNRVVETGALVSSVRLSITGLAADTIYYYRLTATDSANNATTLPATGSAPASFRTQKAPSSSRRLSIWPDTATPAVSDDGDTRAVELGLRFYSDAAGLVMGVRFYKGTPRNIGPHMGNLWDSNGRRLATLTFRSESSSGWQTALFPEPVRIQPNAVYVISYSAPAGHYAVTENALTGRTDRSPLHAPPQAGVYAYGSSVFPTHLYRSSNYWADVLFQPDN